MRENLDSRAASNDRTPVILFGLVPHGDSRMAPDALRELALLADTGTFEVVGCIIQHRRHPDPHTFLGAGKVDEIREIVAQTKVPLVICNDSLTPNQGRNIEKAVGCSVLDRSELILHIFDLHARTPQAKLQVELARLQYQMPRLKRLWSHLERQRGGIGVRGGAGEKQIDVDRSDLRNKIAQTARRLKDIEARKEREIGQRSDQFSIAIVGYTNAGKSTLMNRLTTANVVAQDQLFSTLDTRVRPWRLKGGRLVLLSDTVGFIDNLPHQLVASFHATLQEALSADLLFVMVDASSPRCCEELQIVIDVLERLDADGIPRIVLANKIDVVTDRAQLAPLRLAAPSVVFLSAQTGNGIEQLEVELQTHLAGFEQKVEILIPHSAGHLLAAARSGTTVLSELYTEQGCLLELLISPRLLGRLLSQGAVRATD